MDNLISFVEALFREYLVEHFNYSIFLNSFLANLFSVALFALLVFLLSDFILRLPNINGHWYLITITKEAKLARYKEMELNYTVLLWQEGRKIFGTGEKFREKTKELGEKLYDPGTRRHIEITGYINKKYLKRSRVVLHIWESGGLRESSTVHLVKYKKDKMEGKFVSTISDSSGIILWERKTGLFG